MNAATVLVALAMVSAPDAPAALGAKPGSVPVLYSTDLYHPHGDPDDHFDLATLFAIPEFDVRGVVLDVGSRQCQAPGKTPMEQMIAITGRKVPYAVGLKTPLESPSDSGTDQPEEFQAGVKLLLEALRRAPEPITVFTTGSLRDVTAALVREPDLLRKKIARLYVNIGDSAGGGEHNVGLDRHAYVAVLRSGLPVYWCPCFDGGVWKRDRGYATFWQFTHADVLETAPEKLQNWFIYALTRSAADPIPFLLQAQDAEARKQVWAMRRNMWCTAPFLHAAGRTVVRTESGGWQMRPLASAGSAQRLFDFLPAKVAVEDGGKAALVLDEQTPGERVWVFKILDLAAYDAAMTKVLRELLARP